MPLLSACTTGDGDPTVETTIAIVTAPLTTASPGSAVPTVATSPPAATPAGAASPAEDEAPAFEEGDPVEREVTRPILPTGATITSQFDSDGDGYMTALEFVDAVDASVAQHQWPDAYPVSGEVVADTSFGDRDPVAMGDMFQNGLEHTMVDGWNTCAWYIEWLEARRNGDREREATALDAIVNILPNNPGQAFNANPEFQARYAQQAQLGDPTGVQQYVSVNCSRLPLDQLATDDG